MDQPIIPLGDHMPIYVNFLKTGDGYAIRNKKMSYEISGDLQQNKKHILPLANLYLNFTGHKFDFNFSFDLEGT